MGFAGVVLSSAFLIGMAWIAAKFSGERLDLEVSRDSSGGKAPAALWTFCTVCAAASFFASQPVVGVASGSFALGGFLVCRLLAGSRPSFTAVGLSILLIVMPSALALSMGAPSQSHMLGNQAVAGPLALSQATSGWIARGTLFLTPLVVSLWAESLPRLSLPFRSATVRAIEVTIAVAGISVLAFGPGPGALLWGPLDTELLVAVGASMAVTAACVIATGALRPVAARLQPIA